MSLRFKRGDIVISLPPFRPGVFVITEVDPSRPKNAYNGKDPANGKGYRISDDGLKKIGEATAEYMDGDEESGEEGVGGVSPHVFEQGRMTAVNEARFSHGDEKQRWELLAKAKTGDIINVRLRGFNQSVTFRNVLPRGQKYVFLATNAKGKTYRYPLEIIQILPNA